MKIPTLIAVVATALSPVTLFAQFEPDTQTVPPPLGAPECVIDETTPHVLNITLAPTPFNRLRTGMTPREVRALIGPESFASADVIHRVHAYRVTTGSKGEPLERPRLVFLLFSRDTLTSVKLVDAADFAAELRGSAARARQKGSVATRP